MVKLNNLIINKRIVRKKAEKNKQREDVNSEALQKLTHVCFQNNNIHEIGNISMCINLKVLYLQGNSIVRIENLDSAKKLTHLYLQNNKISKIENLENLRNLEKLFLGRNCITVVEGLDSLTQLRELHLEKQSLPSGEALQFDPRTTESLSESLHLLDVSKNSLTSLCDLCPLKSLQELYADNNALENIKEVCESLRALPNLNFLDLAGNSICSLHKYRDMILISASPNLSYLDRKKVLEVTRQFLKNFECFKKQQSNISIHEQTTDRGGLMGYNENKKNGISDINLYNNIPNKTALVTVNSLFPPWGARCK